MRKDENFKATATLTTIKHIETSRQIQNKKKLNKL